jgi:hypothetical protein
VLDDLDAALKTVPAKKAAELVKECEAGFGKSTLEALQKLASVAL